MTFSSHVFETGAALRLSYQHNGASLRFLRPATSVKQSVTGAYSVAAKFGAKSTTEDVLKGVDLKGKRILVTGVSAGLGVETARALVAHGADVVGAARDLEKAKRTTAQVSKSAKESGGRFEVIELDLASLKSVRAAAD